MKKMYGKDEDPQTGEITEHISQQYDYVWKDGVLDSAKIIVYDEQTGVYQSTTAVKYLYDSEKTPVGFIFTDPNDSTNQDKAWYIKNLQGDVTGVYVEGEGLAVRYSYDAYGKMELLPGTVTGWEGVFLALLVTYVNPFTYRGYQIDIESYTYYLQSRYYDPQMGRFINADDSNYINSGESLVSSNLFAYCGNNPVMFVDIDGYSPKNLEAYLKSINKPVTYGNNKISLKVKENKITISATFKFYGNLFINKVQNLSYGDLFLCGVYDFWQGKFTVFGYTVTLTTNVSVAASQKDYIKVTGDYKLGVSHHMNPLFGWSTTNFGSLTMYKGDSRKNRTYTAAQFMFTAAHEFGHCLGVKDAYTVKNPPDKSIFYEFNTPVQNIDVYKVLCAFMNNKMQSW